MFGIGFQEMLIILVVVLVLFGPKRLPDLARSLGKGIAEFKKASEEVRQGINEAMKEEPSKEDASPAKTDPAPGASPSALPSPVDAAATVPAPGETSPPSAASGQS